MFHLPRSIGQGAIFSTVMLQIAVMVSNPKAVITATIWTWAMPFMANAFQPIFLNDRL
ncbi:hypothetical protein HKCCD6035_04285 [Rhodobacterales bacterium HKCCD6035]|nr:hypothetical protein [Rhodobacterales bacterium HKCCD6035]